MKLKQATQLAIIGVIFQLIAPIIWKLANEEILDYYWAKPLDYIRIAGIALLLPFFITLF